VEQAKVGLETAKTNLEHTKQVLKQKEKDIYSNSKNALAQARIVATNFLNFVDEIMGISDKNKHKNDMFEAYLGAKNTALKEVVKEEWRKAYADYTKWKADIDQLIEDIKNSPDVTADESLKQRIYDALKQTEALFVKLRKLADDFYQVIDSSISAPTFPSSMINQLKQQATEFQSMIEKTLLTAE
jgi:lysophospholipase L1-like esterase